MVHIMRETKMIDSWYDKHTRDFVIQRKNESGDQIAEAVRVGNKSERDYLVNLMRQEEREEMELDNYITLTEWAKEKGIHPDTARQRALRGAFQTAKKFGNIWVISKDEPLIDHRKKERD